jgi:hypothetical protein
MDRYWQRAILVGIVGFAGGCSFGPVNTPAFSDTSCVRRIDPNNGPIKVVEISITDPNTGEVRRNRQVFWPDTQIYSDPNVGRTVTVKYDRREFFLSSKVFVPVELPGGRRYSGWVDTGFFDHLYVTDLAVKQCHLAVFPLGRNTPTGGPVGVCEVPSLRLGKLTIAHPHCVYEQRHWQLRFLGIPLYRHGMVLMGLNLMRLFQYVLFDNVRHEVAFGLYDAFEPDDPSQWVRLPFTLEWIGGNLRMMTELSLGRGAAHMQFDTGGSKPGLVLSQAAWQRLGLRADARDRGNGRTGSVQYGWLPCRMYVLPRLSIDQLNLTKARMGVLPEKSPLLTGMDGNLSLDYFKDTVVVLDFKQNVIWIKQP